VIGLANIAALLAFGLIIGALAGIVVLGTPAVVGGGVTLQPAAGGADPGSHGSCVSTHVQNLLGLIQPGPGFGEYIRAMARRC